MKTNKELVLKLTALPLAHELPEIVVSVIDEAIAALSAEQESSLCCDGWPRHPPCLECGAMTEEEGETKCNAGGDKDHCHGCEIDWQATCPEKPAAEQPVAFGYFCRSCETAFDEPLYLETDINTTAAHCPICRSTSIQFDVPRFPMRSSEPPADTITVSREDLSVMVELWLAGVEFKVFRASPLGKLMAALKQSNIKGD